MPDWFWWGQDGCWFCKQRNNCNQCKANREYVKEFGERGFIKYLPDYDDRYHCLHTSTVLDFTPWGNGEGTITIQTANTEYILTKQ